MQVGDLLNEIERFAPAALAQPGDNCGLLVGDRATSVRRILAALELTGPVLDEAIAGGFDTVVTHHPLLFAPVRSLVEAHPREELLRRLVKVGITLIACHTNLDAAPGGLAQIAGEALGLQNMTPLDLAQAARYKLVGFVPAEAMEAVAAAVFAAGAGHVGDYRDCAFASQGTGWFTAMPGSHPTVGEVARPERTPEVRWEVVVPRGLVAETIRAYIGAHPYEEPAYDIYPIEDVVPRAGLGRVGALSSRLSLCELARRVADTFEAAPVAWSGDGARVVQRVAVLPGSGRGLLDAALGRCDVLVTGDLGYHAAQEAEERGLSLIDVPHGRFEWWAFRRWIQKLSANLHGAGVVVSISNSWRPPWEAVDGSGTRAETSGASIETPSVPPTAATDAASEAIEEVLIAAAGDRLRLWVDGGSRGNPGPSAIGVVVEDADGHVIDTVSRGIGVGTNNVAEYRALLVALERAAELGASHVEVASDSELLVKQMRGEYRVKNAGLTPLHAEARVRAGAFCSFVIRHVQREQNARADALVNQALDEQEKAGL